LEIDQCGNGKQWGLEQVKLIGIRQWTEAMEH